MRKGYDQQMGVERRMMSDLDTRGVLGYATESVEFNSIIKSWESVRPKPGDFKNVYPDNEIATDAASVAEIKRSATYQREKTRDQVASEYVIMEQVYNGGLGEEVGVTPTSEYDDIKNGVDFVVAFPAEEGKDPVYIGVDVTTGPVITIQKKLGRTARGLKNSELANIKYYIDDENPDYKGNLSVPRVVVGIEPERVKQIYDNFITSKKNDIDPQFQAEMLDEMAGQLKEGLLYLIENFVGTGGEKLTTAEQILDFCQKKQHIIEKREPQVTKSVQSYFRALARVIELKKITPHSDVMSEGDRVAV